MVTVKFIIEHMQMKSGYWSGGQWNGRAIFCCSTDSATSRTTMLVERTELGPSGRICVPPFTELVFIDETQRDQYHDPLPLRPN